MGKGNEHSDYFLLKNTYHEFLILAPITLPESADTKVREHRESKKHPFYNTLYLIKESAFFVYTGMLYSLCILQGYKTSLILNITPKVISEKKKLL